MKSFTPFQLIVVLASALILLFIIAPLAGMFVATSPADLFETAKDIEVQQSIKLTLWVSLAATVVFSVAAIPFSYLLARKSFPLKSIVTGIIDLPIVIPHSAAGIAILGFVSRNSLLGKAGSAIGLDFVGHPAGIAVAMAFCPGVASRF